MTIPKPASSDEMRRAIALAIYEVGCKAIQHNFPPGHVLTPFDELRDFEQKLHFDYADAALAAAWPFYLCLGESDLP